MNPLHTHLLGQISDALRAGVAVVVDPEAAFGPFFDELTSAVAWDSDHPDTARISVGSASARFARYDGSWFGLRSAIEPFLNQDTRPDPPLLIYVPTALPPPTSSVLAEAVLAGRRLDWALDREARAALRQRTTEGVIDEVLAGGTATYADVVAFLGQGARGVSRLKALYPHRSDTEILLGWLVDDGHDAGVQAKGAATELGRLVASRLGLELPEGAALSAWRTIVARAVLLAEFIEDLGGDPPSGLATLARPLSAAHVEEALSLAARFRAQHPEAYTATADRLEADLRLARLGVDPARLGRIDTFRFEERLLLERCARLLVERLYADGMALVTARGSSFWVERDVNRKADWELCRRVAELGLRLDEVARDLPGGGAPIAEWVRRYAAPGGWHELDRAQRALETFRAQLADEAAGDQAAAIALRAHEALSQKMAERFQRALEGAGWAVPGVLHQTRVYADVVAPRGGTVGYLWVDALRYEMGAELARLLDGAEDLQLRPAVAALPTITPVGMAALLPGAASRFSVAEKDNKLIVLVDGNAVATPKDRERHVRARVPDSADMTLATVLQARPADLRGRVAGKALVVVRSQEIDELGEKGNDWLARRAMAEVLGDLARAVRKLHRAGVEHFVITADHGHQFGLRKGDDMKTDAPGGQTVDLHRRCWIGRGGATPAGAARVSAAQLGYQSDLEFVFPTGLGVLKAGGDLSFHHGSTSLQELVVPVLSFRLPLTPEAAGGPEGLELRLLDAPDAVTNLFFTVRVEVVAQTLFSTEPARARVVLLADAEQVGHAAMADVPDFDRASGVLTVKPGARAQLGLRLTREDAASVRIVALDPETGITLASAGPIPVRLLR